MLPYDRIFGGKHKLMGERERETKIFGLLIDIFFLDQIHILYSLCMDRKRASVSWRMARDNAGWKWSTSWSSV